ncbi:MAG: hypothetical protein ACYS7Y_20195 [Planctomycetota bacterium]|jgi:hypothetical protein
MAVMGSLVDHVESLEPGPVNLDGMHESELYVFAAATRGTSPRRAARRLFPEMPSGVLQVVRDLKNYAWNKVTAMACRSRGEIDTAIMYEGICERIYEDLPEYARW